MVHSELVHFINAHQWLPWNETEGGLSRIIWQNTTYGMDKPCSPQNFTSDSDIVLSKQPNA